MKYRLNMLTRTNEFDMNDQLTVYAILDYFQQAASIHATKLGLGFDVMYEQKMLWVVLRIKFNVLQNTIKPLEEVTLETWPEPKGKIEFGRSHIVYDANNEIAITGKASWVVIDSEKRRLLRARDVTQYSDSFTEKSVYDTELHKLEPFDYKQMEKAYTYTIYKMDLDHNGHVNNTRYANMAFNAIDYKGRKIKSGQIDFVNEAKLNDLVDIYVLDLESSIKIMGIIEDKISFIMYLDF